MQPTRQQTSAPITEATPDVQLARRAAAGEEAAFGAIMRRHNQLLFRTARSILKSDAEAEDALQDAYLRAWSALGNFRAEARLSAWLVRIVANEALGHLRRKRPPVVPLDAVMTAHDAETRNALMDDPDELPDRTAMRAQLRRLLEARIDLLPEVFRKVFMLRAVEEWSVAEVADALEIPEATVRTRFFRARSPDARKPSQRHRPGTGRCLFVRRRTLRPNRSDGAGTRPRRWPRHSLGESEHDRRRT